MNRYWSQKYAAAQVSDSAVDRLLSHSKALGPIDLHVSFEELCKISNLAPTPLPAQTDYLIPHGVLLLYSLSVFSTIASYCFCAWTKDGHLPHDVNFALL